MAVYKCSICGYEYDEDKSDIKFEDLPSDWTCPACGVPKELFELTQDNVEKETVIQDDKRVESDIDYAKDLYRKDSIYEEHMELIHNMSLSGKYIVEPMKSGKKIISWDDILIMGAQLFKRPLNDDEPVNTKVIIGKNAKKPMELKSPIYISHMSFGALSREAKIALAKGSSMARTAMCSGEGGILPEEFENSYKYIFEYVPNLYSVSDENLKKVDAIEIKIGQGSKPGMGGQLPGEKVTEEIAKIRGREIGKDIISPSHFEQVKSKEDLKKLVDELREKSEGRPIGIKIAAGNIEKDMEYIEYANPDFLTIDGRGGSTGASPKVLKDATSIPTIFALYKAKKYINDHNLDISLIITGGLRISSDFAKAIAMGADAVAIATSALMALGCMQYRICNNGKCPMGIATQDEELRKRLKIDQAAQRVANFLNASNDELKTFARITGNNDIYNLGTDDLVTTNIEISNFTNIKHV